MRYILLFVCCLNLVQTKAQKFLNFVEDEVAPSFISVALTDKVSFISSQQDFYFRVKDSKWYFTPTSRVDFVNFSNVNLYQKGSSASPDKIVPAFTPWFMTWNIGIGAQSFPYKTLHFGANLDVIGFSLFGKSGYNFNNNGTPESRELKPSRLNLLLGGSNDIGTLNSQFYVGGRLFWRVWMRGGLAHTVIGVNGAGLGNDFQRFDTMYFLALGIGQK